MTDPFFAIDLRREIIGSLSTFAIYVAAEKINEGKTNAALESSRLLHRGCFCARAAGDTSGHNEDPTGSQMSLSVR
jgi:hypothetical protein